MSRFVLSTAEFRLFGLDGLEWSVTLVSSTLLGLVLLSQKVAAFADENHVFGKIQFQHAGG